MISCLFLAHSGRLDTVREVATVDVVFCPLNGFCMALHSHSFHSAADFRMAKRLPTMFKSWQKNIEIKIACWKMGFVRFYFHESLQCARQHFDSHQLCWFTRSNQCHDQMLPNFRCMKIPFDIIQSPVNICSGQCYFVAEEAVNKELRNACWCKDNFLCVSIQCWIFVLRSNQKFQITKNQINFSAKSFYHCQIKCQRAQLNCCA